MSDFIKTLSDIAADYSLGLEIPTPIENIEALVEKANELYRLGIPVVSDHVYDHILLPALRLVKPDSGFLDEVEPEPEGVFGKTVELPERMLSTQKAYSIEEIEKWAQDVIAAGREQGLKDIYFKITPKLDGFAAYDDGKILYTRGNGRQGTDITRAFDRGLKVLLSRESCAEWRYAGGFGKGEIVVNKEYFKTHLADKFENSRNVIAAVIKEGEPDPAIQAAIDGHAVVFAPFCNIASYSTDIDGILYALAEQFEFIWKDLVGGSDFDTDGLVIEAVHPVIKEARGSTNHHHRWQIAYKRNTEFHDIRVTGISWQTAKTGRITPVVELEPTKVSGVTISRATGHHLGNIRDNLINVGAVVKVCRSGQVIPYISEVVEPALTWQAPEFCPSCGDVTEIEEDTLRCSNDIDCPAQIEGVIEHFFKTIGNCDGFGPIIIGKLHASGVNSVVDIFKLELSDYLRAGIGEKTANNLMLQLDTRQQLPLEDWRFLAAFSIPMVGKGGCEKLLRHYRIEDIFDLTVDRIVLIDGFAERTASMLVESLAKIRPAVEYLLPKMNIVRSQGVDRSGSPIAGKTIVFTGTMVSGGRADLEKRAKELGAKVAGSVSGKTNYLVCGDNVGANKTEAAKKHGVLVLSEDEYLRLIG